MAKKPKQKTKQKQTDPPMLMRSNTRGVGPKPLPHLAKTFMANRCFASIFSCWKRKSFQVHQTSLSEDTLSIEKFWGKKSGWYIVVIG